MLTHSRCVVTVPNRLSMTNVAELTDALAPLVQCCRERERIELVVDMSRVGFTRPTGLAVLTAVISHMMRADLLVGGEIIAATNPNMHGYLERMDFYNILNVEVPSWSTRRSSAGRFREVVEVATEDMVGQVAQELIDILQNNVNMSKEAIKALQFAVPEMIDNVFHHAQSPVNAIVCAQTYPSQRKVEIAIVDCGRGFKTSLGNNPDWTDQITSSTDALNLAIQLRVTGRPLHNTGMGLFFAAELARQNGGDFLIYSEDGALLVSKGQQTLKQHPWWPGSIVSLRLSLDNAIDLTELFQEHDPREEDDLFEVAF